MAETSGRKLTSYLENPGADAEELRQAFEQFGFASASQGELAETAVQPSEIPTRVASAMAQDGSGSLAAALAVLLANSSGAGRDSLKAALEAILGDEPAPVIAGRPIGLLLALTRVN